MAGIYGVLLTKTSKNEAFKYFYNASFPNIIGEEIVYKKYRFGRSVLNKFQKDRFLYEDYKYIICFEGINYSPISNPKMFIREYEKRGEKFISELKGSFSGFIFSKESEEIIIFNDILSTRVLYYYYDANLGFAFASEMHVLSKILRSTGISLNYDYNGIYAVALYGQTFYNFTTVNEIKKLNYGSTLIFNSEQKFFKETSYFKFKRDEKFSNISDTIEKIDSFFIAAIQEEWEKDTMNNYEHFGLISGGMDSRVNLLIARRLGFEKINTYTYGDPHSSDIKIAQQIAKENFYSHKQFNLFHGKFLIENTLQNYVKATDGLTYFTANAVIYNAFQKIDFQTYGQVHSGQLGDTATGAFVKPAFDFKANIDKIGVTGFVKHKELLSKLSFLDTIVDQYNHTDNEVFTYEQRQVNGTLMGDKVFNNFIDLASPFYDKSFLKVMLSLPQKFKMNQRIYFEWLKVKHPDVLEYKWEKIGLKPNSLFNIKYGRLVKRYINGGKKYFGLDYDNMSPIHKWLKKDSMILDEFDTIFNNHIDLIKDVELKEDLKKIYFDDIFEYRNKFSVLSVLLGVKMHFYED